MLSNSKLQKSFWVEAVATTCFLINRSLSVTIDKKTPIEVWSGNPIVYSDLNIFDCPAYARVDNGKLEPRPVKCVFLGYKNDVKSYKLCCPKTCNIIVSRDIIFDETTMLRDLPTNDSCDTS